MAIVRDFNNSDNYLTYLSTVALFCGISCTILMLRFRGFKATLNISSEKTNGKHYELAPQVSVVGAYRTSREEYFGNINYLDSRKTIIPQSKVKLPPTNVIQVIENSKTSRSTSDLTNVQNTPADVRQSTPNISVLNATQENRHSKKQLKDEKKLEKERLLEQKKREKLAAQEREKQEKLRKEREKHAAQKQAKEAKEKEKQRKTKPPVPQSQQNATSQQIDTREQKSKSTQQRVGISQKSIAPPAPPLPIDRPEQPNANPLSQRQQYSTNTLESSISRSSGPPPYSDESEIVQNKSDNTGNISFGKSAETSSWDLISQHRQQMSKTGPTTNMSTPKQMDLRYNVGNLTSEDKDNSEA